jgi:lactoylglutathione lyase
MKYTKLTPNLVVRDVQAAVQFYESVLGFRRGMSVPDNPPFVFASVTNGAGVESFFNDQKMVGEDYPPLAKDPLGGSLTLFIECEGIEEILAAVQKSAAKVVMPLKTQFYGMREFASQDPEGWIVTMAERVK